MTTAKLMANLTDAQIEEFGREVDAIGEEVMASRGEKDRAYILRLIRTQRLLALGGRVVMLLSIWFLPAIGLPLAGWPQLLVVLGLGATMLGLAKFLRTWRSGTTSCMRNGTG